jgi:hypothetical protein
MSAECWIEEQETFTEDWDALLREFREQPIEQPQDQQRCPYVEDLIGAGIPRVSTII